jgi:hypothetical protein
VRRRLFPGTRPRFVCTTNNYALFKRPGIWSMFDSHVLASRWVEAHPRGRLRSIERRLSAMNRTLASQTSLALGKPTVTRAECLHKLRRYRALYRAPIAPELEWSRPYLAMMAELMDELEVLPSRR